MIFKGSEVPVQEVFLGRTTEIGKFFNYFSKIRSACVEMQKAPTQKELDGISKYIEDIFGFGTVQFSILPNDTINAMTYPATCNVFMNTDNIIKTTTTGYKFKKDANVAMISYCTRGLFLSNQFTDEECFAALLHEIGHSFIIRGNGIDAVITSYNYSIIYKITINMVLAVMSGNLKLILSGAIVTAKTLTYTTNKGKEIVVKINKGMQKVELLNMIKKAQEASDDIFTKIISGIFYVLTRPVTLIFAIPMKVLTKAFNSLTKICGGSGSRSIEYLADDFAVVYGFGPAIASFNAKLGKTGYIEDKTNPIHRILTSSEGPIKNILEYTDKVERDLLLSMDVHPADDKRVFQVRKSLLYELDHVPDVDTKIKAEIKANILELCNVIEEIQTGNDIIYENKEDAILACKKIVNAKGKKLDADWAEAHNLARSYMDADFKRRNKK